MDDVEDEVRKAVIGAFREAEAQGRGVTQCYLAAVAVWRSRYPEHAPAYAAHYATSIVLEQRARAMLARLTRDQSVGDLVAPRRPAAGRARRPAPPAGASIDLPSDGEMGFADGAAEGAPAPPRAARRA